jgi:hypothetical protein
LHQLTIGVTVNAERLERWKNLVFGPEPTEVPRRSSILFSIDENAEVVNKWNRELAELRLDPIENVTECLKDAENLDIEEQDKIQFIMNSEELYEWLSRSQPCVLRIEAETPPDDLINALSSTAALLAKTLEGSSKHPVLSYFCGLRTNTSTDENYSGPMALLNSLNSQLLFFIQQNRSSTVDLSFLGKYKQFQKSHERPKYALDLFTRLLQLLPQTDVVFILIDSFSQISKDKEEADRILQRILNMTKKESHIILKILVTDCLPGCCIKRLHGLLSLFVPDHVDGERYGINMDFFELKNKTVIEEFEGRQKRNEYEESDDY